MKYPTASQTRPLTRKNKNPQKPIRFIQVLNDFLFFSVSTIAIVCLSAIFGHENRVLADNSFAKSGKFRLESVK
jgi:hypothetical protein